MTANPSQGFYGRWAHLYDVLSHRTPGISTLRAAAVESLDLDAGDTVIDLGCGAGPNVPHLRRAVGPMGHVVGVDFTRPILQRARRTHAAGNVTFTTGDVTDLPIKGPVDAIVSSFLSGMLPEPTTTITRWTDLVRPGGRVALLDAALSGTRVAWPLNQIVKAIIFASAPRKLRAWNTAPWTTVTKRVDLAAAELDRQSTATSRQSWLLGTVRLTTGHIE